MNSTISILDYLNDRRSHRLYQKKLIPENIIDNILRAAFNAPFGGSPKPKCQVFEAIIVSDMTIKEKLALHYEDRQFIKLAPIVVACCANKNNDPDYMEWLISTSMSIQNLITAAEFYGLGSCFITCFLHHENHNEDRLSLRNSLGLPDNIELVGLISLGYKVPTEIIKEKVLRKIGDVISYEQYGIKL